MSEINCAPDDKNEYNSFTPLLDNLDESDGSDELNESDEFAAMGVMCPCIIN